MIRWLVMVLCSALTAGVAMGLPRVIRAELDDGQRDWLYWLWYGLRRPGWRRLRSADLTEPP